MNHELAQLFFGKSLQVVEWNGKNYLNVDMTTIQGIKRAKELQLLDYMSVGNVMIVSPQLNVILQQLLSSSSSQSKKGRLIVWMRHPIHRIVQQYTLMTTPGQSQFNPTIASMSLLEYVTSSHCENNIITRTLTNTISEEEIILQQDHLLLAKDILKQKCFIGLYDQLSESLDRLERLFHWKPTTNTILTKPFAQLNECHDVHIEKLQLQKQRQQYPEENSEVWNAILEKNYMDMELYKLSQQLFIDQGRLYFKFRQQIHHHRVPPSNTNHQYEGHFPSDGYT